MFITSEQSKPYFISYGKIEEGYYTKTTLRNEFGLKPKDELEYDAIAKLYLNNKWGEYFLYKMENCIEIKRRKVKELEITDENIASALYVINKSAKVSRDTKSKNYKEANYGIVAASKTRENKLYAIKNLVLKRLKNEGKLNILGYHTIFAKDYILSELKGFTFHQDAEVNENLEGLAFLGEIDSVISSEKTRRVTINFFEAQNLLLRYIGMDRKEFEMYLSSKGIYRCVP